MKKIYNILINKMKSKKIYRIKNWVKNWKMKNIKIKIKNRKKKVFIYIFKKNYKICNTMIIQIIHNSMFNNKL
jgi:hypothetical protein